MEAARRLPQEIGTLLNKPEKVPQRTVWMKERSAPASLAKHWNAETGDEAVAKIGHGDVGHILGIVDDGHHHDAGGDPVDHLLVLRHEHVVRGRADEEGLRRGRRVESWLRWQAPTGRYGGAGSRQMRMRSRPWCGGSGAASALRVTSRRLTVDLSGASRFRRFGLCGHAPGGAS